ncbi:MAG: T9SS type A sorting domain-containing protein [Ignavibacteriae bacterium]|nr:T9SS type A sorting domain-containing protein [Ignavibacteriota bacterium]
MKFLLTLISIWTYSLLLINVSNSQTYRGIIYKSGPLSFCQDGCDRFYLQPDSGYSFTYLLCDLDEYIGMHVEVTGYRTSCVECFALTVINISVLPPLGVDEPQYSTPTGYMVKQNFPNPFNPSTIVEFDLPKDAKVTLKIYDLLGREVITLKDNEQYEAGTHEVEFSANQFASGVYFYRIVAHNGTTFTDVKKMVLLK